MIDGPTERSTSDKYRNPYATGRPQDAGLEETDESRAADRTMSTGIEEKRLAAEDQEAPADGGEPEARPGWAASARTFLKRRAVPLLAAAAVVFVSLTAVLLVLLIQNSGTDPQEVARLLNREQGQVNDRAARVIALLMNYDATNLDEVADEILEISTGNFKEQYQDIIQRNLGRALEEASASSRGQIVSGPDVAFESPSEAVAIARVEQTTQSNENPSGRTFVYVLQVTLVDTEAAGWKVDRVEILSAEER